MDAIRRLGQFGRFIRKTGVRGRSHDTISGGIHAKATDCVRPMLAGLNRRGTARRWPPVHARGRLWVPAFAGMTTERSRAWSNSPGGEVEDGQGEGLGAADEGSTWQPSASLGRSGEDPSPTGCVGSPHGLRRSWPRRHPMASRCRRRSRMRRQGTLDAEGVLEALREFSRRRRRSSGYCSHCGSGRRRLSGCRQRSRI